MKGYKENRAGREPGKYRDPIAGNLEKGKEILSSN